MSDIYSTARVIRLKRREYQTPQGCKVESVWFTDLRGVITEVVTLSTQKQPARVKS